MVIKGSVINAHVEDRELVGKDGLKRQTKITHVLLMVKKSDGKGSEVVNLRCYDAKFPLPELGKEWETPAIRKYENYDGNVAEVMV